MSKKATSNSRSVNKALARTSRAASDAKLLSESAGLSRDAAKAAVAAACAVERANTEQGLGSKGTVPLKGIVKDVRTATEEAVDRARNAIKAADGGDVAGAAHLANLSARAAQRAGALSTAVSVLVDTARALASDRQPEAPAITARETRAKSERDQLRRDFESAIIGTANYLVTRDRRIIATFAREEDAFLLESELAELDCERAAREGSAADCRCEVLDRRTGSRLGGYLLTSGKMIVFLRDEERDARFGKRRR